MAERESTLTRATARLVGVLLCLIGVTLVSGGAWLTAMGGSLYYLLAGVVMLFAGIELIRLRERGVWTYCTLVGATVVWALWESGLDGWALLPRVAGPIILLIPTLVLVPLLSRRTNATRHALIAASASALTALAILLSVTFKPEPAPNVWPESSGNWSVAHGVGDDWPAYGGTYSAQRYSPLDQINVENVSQIERVWVAHTHDLPANPYDNKYGAETTPLKIGDRLFLCSATSILLALDARTGRELWRYDPGVQEQDIPYTAACRGVTYFEADHDDGSAQDSCSSRVIAGTLDARLIAVDAATGRPCSGFGAAGEVDITLDMGEMPRGMVAITSPPTIVRGVIVTGHQVFDGQDRNKPSGVVQGYDAETGERLWGWDMVRPDWVSGPPPGEVWSRGTPNMWTIASGDESLGLVYLPMGNSAADYDSGTRRPAENEHASSLVAIDATTGRKVWSFQTVRMDVWDYDLGSQATLLDYPVGGSTVPALVLPTKQGDIYILDRRTGAPLTGVENRTVPQGGAEPENRSLTQPFSLFHSLAQPDLHESDMWGISPIDQMICRIQFRLASYSGIYTPPTLERPYIQYPGYNGGSDWGGVALDPVRGILLANYNDLPNYNRLILKTETNEIPPTDRSLPNTPFEIVPNPGWRMPWTALPCKRPPYGGLRAIDIRDGRTIWDRPFGTAHSNGPFKRRSRLPFEVGTPNNGGGVVTAGGLLFIAATTDNHLRAIEIRTGKTVWKDRLPSGGQATPMTYALDGRQYVVIMTGGHHFMETPIGDEVIAYALSSR